MLISLVKVECFFVEREYSRWSEDDNREIREFFKDHIYGSGMPGMFNMLPRFLLCDAMHIHGLAIVHHTASLRPQSYLCIFVVCI